MIHIIVNPAGAGGAAAKTWRRVKKMLREEQVPYKVHFSRPELDVDALVRNVCKKWAREKAEIGSVEEAAAAGRRGETDYLTLVVIGGDGTMNLAVNGITDFDRVRVGFIPCGSGNDLARSLGISKDAKRELSAILERARADLTDQDGTAARELDIGEILYFRCFLPGSDPSGDSDTDDLTKQVPPSCDTDDLTKEVPPFRSAKTEAETPVCTRLFNISSGIGFDASVCYEVSISRMKPFLNKIGLGKLAYLAAAIRTVFRVKLTEAEITIDGKPMRCDELLLAACMNEPYQGGGFRFGPEADATDGILDLCVANGVTSGAFFRIFPTAYTGQHVRFRGVDVYRGSVIDIKTRRPMWVHTDGETEFMSDHVLFRVREEKLRMLN